MQDKTIDRLQPFRPAYPVVGQPIFLSPVPNLHHLKSGLALTLDDLSYRDRFGAVWTCPRGFLTDGASVPWLLRWLWSPWDGDTLRVAIIHDMRYALHDYFKDWIEFDNRPAADQSLLDGMRIDCPSRAKAYYIAVRLFGRSVYEYVNEEEMMLEWIAVLQKNDDKALDLWIQGVIEEDKAA